MNQEKVEVTAEISGLIVFEPRPLAPEKFRISNGVVDVHKNRPFWIFINNFGASVQNVQKILEIYNTGEVPVYLRILRKRFHEK